MNKQHKKKKNKGRERKRERGIDCMEVLTRPFQNYTQKSTLYIKYFTLRLDY